ncbi:MAG: DUF2752 domain-containing protein [Nitrospinae bacterium]|nr:DUF2752 domain-containing protein [Nitrospinota bacterium]MBI3813259.1 DUF2752 domain-containing protein [Nitrospinota bacterium]
MKKFLIPKGFVFPLFAALLIIAILHYSGIFPIYSVENFSPVFCPVKTVFGIQCPGCGMTRAFLSLIRGEIGNAFHFNPFSFFLFFYLLVSLTPDRFLQKLPSRAEHFAQGFLMLTIFSVVTFWVFFRIL